MPLFVVRFLSVPRIRGGVLSSFSASSFFSICSLGCSDILFDFYICEAMWDCIQAMSEHWKMPSKPEWESERDAEAQNDEVKNVCNLDWTERTSVSERQRKQIGISISAGGKSIKEMDDVFVGSRKKKLLCRVFVCFVLWWNAQTTMTTTTTTTNILPSVRDGLLDISFLFYR